MRLDKEGLEELRFGFKEDPTKNFSECTEEELESWTKEWFSGHVHVNEESIHEILKILWRRERALKQRIKDAEEAHSDVYDLASLARNTLRNINRDAGLTKKTVNEEYRSPSWQELNDRLAKIESMSKGFEEPIIVAVNAESASDHVYEDSVF